MRPGSHDSKIQTLFKVAVDKIQHSLHALCVSGLTGLWLVRISHGIILPLSLPNYLTILAVSQGRVKSGRVGYRLGINHVFEIHFMIA